MILKPKYGTILRTTKEYFVAVTGDDWYSNEAVCRFVDILLDKETGDCCRESMYCSQFGLLNVHVGMNYQNDVLDIRLKTHDPKIAEEWGLPLVAEAQQYPYQYSLSEEREK